MTSLTSAAQKQLKSFIERIERIMEERKALGGDIKEIFDEAKGVGFDAKIMRKVLAVRAKPQTTYNEEQAILDTYMLALGMADTPLGDYMERQRMVTVDDGAVA